MNNMGASDAYVVVSVAISLAATVLSMVNLWRVVVAYRRFHDDYAAVTLVKGIGISIIAGGMLVSSIGLWLGLGVGLWAIGLGLARGALLVLTATLVVANVELPRDNPCEGCPAPSCAGCTRAIKDDLDHQ